MARKTATRVGRPGQPDFIEFGSEQHANLLQIRPARDGDKYVVEGADGRKWSLMDATAYGPQATGDYIQEVLRQKVSEFETPAPEIQSDDPWLPGYAPRMIVPPEERDRLSYSLEEMERIAS